jgi:hypothetical protein
LYIKIETARLDYFRTKKEEIRSDVYEDIIDSIIIGETRGSKIGRRIILPASFIGGPRDMRKLWHWCSVLENQIFFLQSHATHDG